jgi:tyrosine-protein phosphatase SIW14
MSQYFRSLGAFALLVLLLAPVCAQDTVKPQASNSAQRPNRSIGQKRPLKGLPNFGEVTPILFRGAQPSPDGLKTLARMGVNIVVDARGDRADSEGKQVTQLGMRYVPIPWRCPFPNDDIFVKFLKLVRDNPDKKIFVHCRLGDDRTGMMVAAYRMAAEGWSADEAMHEMQQFGFSALHQYFLCPRLASYEKAFPDHLKKNPALQGQLGVAQGAQQ